MRKQKKNYFNYKIKKFNNQKKGYRKILLAKHISFDFNIGADT